MRHFQKIAEGIDFVPIMTALSVNSDLWNENDLRTTHPQSPHSETDDIWLWFNDVSDPIGVMDDCDVVPYRGWDVLPARDMVLDIMRRVSGTRLGRVIISRLRPGASIAPHVDHGAPATYYSRFHVALQCLPGALNISGGESVQYRPGEVWWFNNKVEHSIVNNSADDRIVMVMDVRC